jgi:uncharacterized protein (PEP-CTERM system associated)
LKGFLDAILTTRTPDPVQRSALVGELLASRGLRNAIPSAIPSSADYAQLRSGSELTWVYLGKRTTLSLALFAQELKRISRSDAPAAPDPGAGDSRQHGVSFGWNRRLSSVSSLDAAAAWSRIAGLALRDGDLTREGSVRASLVRNLSPRTDVSLGVSYRKIASNVSTVNSFDETAGLIGLAHRF